MKKMALAAIAAFMLLGFSGNASAAEQDMLKITCKDFMASATNTQHMTVMLSWIDGYMSAKSDNSVMSDEWMEKLGKHMATYCQANPDKTMQDAMEAVPAE